MTTVTADRGASAEPVDPITVDGDRRRPELDRGRHGLPPGTHVVLVDHPRVRGLRLRDLRPARADSCARRRSRRRCSPGRSPGYLAGIERRFAELGDKWRPGDVVVHNHPYYGASHQPDVRFCVPVFVGDELVGFSVTTAHHLDLGALSPGHAAASSTPTNAYAEGLLLNAVQGRGGRAARSRAPGGSSPTTRASRTWCSATWRPRWPPPSSAPCASASSWRSTAWMRCGRRPTTHGPLRADAAQRRSRRCPTAATRPRA